MKQAIAAVIVAAQLAGCAALTVEPLRRRSDRAVMPRCSAARLPIAADLGLTLVALFGTALATGWIGEELPDDDNTNDYVVGGTFIGGFGVSAAYGILQRRRCEHARDAHEQGLAERAYGEPGAWQPGPPGSR